MPSFSKECFGGFVGFQEVTIDPNKKAHLQTFVILDWAKNSPRAPAPFGIAAATCKDVSMNSVFQKAKSSFRGDHTATTLNERVRDQREESWWMLGFVWLPRAFCAGS
jgi:hypothetical protein